MIVVSGLEGTEGMLKVQDWQSSTVHPVTQIFPCISPPSILGIETSESYDVCFIATDAEILPIVSLRQPELVHPQHCITPEEISG